MIDSARIWTESGDVHVDVRGLPAPEPFTAIMELVRARRAPIVVHHELEAEYRTAILHAMHMDTQPIVDLLAKCVELTYVDLTAAR